MFSSQAYGVSTVEMKSTASCVDVDDVLVGADAVEGRHLVGGQRFLA